MAQQKSSLSLIPVANSRVSPARAVATPEPEDLTVEEEARTIKLQFRRVYKNLRCLVLDLLSRERTGLTGRRRSAAEESRRSVSQRGTKTSPSKTANVSEDSPQGSNDSNRRCAKNAVPDMNNKTVLDTLSTILTSCTYDEDWDPLVCTLPAPLDDTAAMIRPGLYISGFLAEQNKADLENKGITHILQVGENLTRSYEGEFKYKNLALTDVATTYILPVLKECLEYLDECVSNGGSALVHCYAGISRSATICIAYLMWSENLSLGAAYSMVERARSVAQPNEGFKSQLRVFESLGSNLGNLEQYLSRQPKQTPYRALSSDDWDFIL